MSTAFVVFYRNLNLGHRNSPSRAVLEDVLRDAGGSFARSFQTNGTVLIEAGDTDPRDLIRRAAPQLLRVSGYDDAAFARPLDQLATILDRDPFAGASGEDTYLETFTFFDSGHEFGASIPWTNRHGNLDIIEIIDGVALSVVRKTGTRVGNPTAEMEARLGVPATTRTVGTIKRLVKAFRGS